jgi:hypothetical protein
MLKNKTNEPNRFIVIDSDKSGLFYRIEEQKLDYSLWEKSQQERWLPVRTFVAPKTEIIFN